MTSPDDVIVSLSACAAQSSTGQTRRLQQVVPFCKTRQVCLCLYASLTSDCIINSRYHKINLSPPLFDLPLHRKAAIFEFVRAFDHILLQKNHIKRWMIGQTSRLPGHEIVRSFHVTKHPVKCTSSPALGFQHRAGRGWGGIPKCQHKFTRVTVRVSRSTAINDLIVTQTASTIAELLVFQLTEIVQIDFGILSMNNKTI